MRQAEACETANWEAMRQLPTLTGATGAALQRLVEATNTYCTEDDESIRLEIGREIAGMDLEGLLMEEDGELSNTGPRVLESKSDHLDNIFEDKGGGSEATVPPPRQTPKSDTRLTPELRSKGVFLHAVRLTRLITAVGRAPLELFDRIEYRAGELLRVHSLVEASAEAEWARDKGMRPPSRGDLRTPQSPQQMQRAEQRQQVDWDGAFGGGTGLSAFNSRLRRNYWEHDFEATLAESLNSLDTTQEMEFPFLNLRETLAQTLTAEEQRHRQAIGNLTVNAEAMNLWLQHAGSVQGTKDMVIRARMSKFIENCHTRVAEALGTMSEEASAYFFTGGAGEDLLPEVGDESSWHISCPMIARLRSTISTLIQMEEQRQNLIRGTYAFVDNVVRPEIDAVLDLRHELVATYFAKQRSGGRIQDSERRLVDAVNALWSDTFTKLNQQVSDCAAAAEDLKITMYDIRPGFDEIVRRAEMVGGTQGVVAFESADILRDRDELHEELRKKKEAQLQADLEAAARGGKSMEQVLQDRQRNDAASRIQRVYRAFLSRANRVNTGGVWTEIGYSSKVLVSALESLLHALRLDDDDSYEANMIMQMEQRVFKLNEQVTYRNLGPSMKQDFVVEKRWPIIGAMLQKWTEEANLAALGEDDRGDSSDYTDSDDSMDWDSADLMDSSEEEDDVDDSEDDSDIDSDASSDLGDFGRGRKGKGPGCPGPG